MDMIQMECECGFCTENRIAIETCERDHEGSYICPYCGEKAIVTEYND